MKATEETRVGDARVHATTSDEVRLWLDNYDGMYDFTPEESVQLSRALVKAAAEALGVKKEEGAR